MHKEISQKLFNNTTTILHFVFQVKRTIRLAGRNNFQTVPFITHMSRIFNTGEHTMKNTRLSRYFLIIGIVCPLVAAARIGETPDESQKRYGAATPAATDHVILANARIKQIGRSPLARG